MSAFGGEADLVSTGRAAHYDFFLTKKLVSAAAKNLVVTLWSPAEWAAAKRKLARYNLACRSRPCSGGAKGEPNPRPRECHFFTR